MTTYTTGQGNFTEDPDRGNVPVPETPETPRTQAKTHNMVRSRFTGEFHCEDCDALLLNGSGRVTGECSGDETPETPRTPLADSEPREWALGAARQDTNFLISPRARERALEILANLPLTPLTRAAILVLNDGGSQQGLEGYRSAPTFAAWRDAADTLIMGGLDL